jgi:hypothetical protein
MAPGIKSTASFASHNSEFLRGGLRTFQFLSSGDVINRSARQGTAILVEKAKPER